jgi:hypothetical protein
MGDFRLSTTITGCQASGLPLRRLDLQCKIQNDSKFSICILDTWISVMTKNGLTIAEGKILTMYHALADLAIIKPGQFGHGVITIHLPAIVLRCLEEHRSGGDIDLSIHSRVLACEVRQKDRVVILGQPRETRLGHDSLDYHIPQSEWVKHLKMLAWSEIELIELPARTPQAKPNLIRALERYNDALDCYRRGMWDETLLNCRKSFEALIKVTGGSDDMARASEAVNSLVSDGQKAKIINEIIRSLADFLHLGRHEQLHDLKIVRCDALLSLHLTGALLEYLGSS